MVLSCVQYNCIVFIQPLCIHMSLTLISSNGIITNPCRKITSNALGRRLLRFNSHRSLLPFTIPSVSGLFPNYISHELINDTTSNTAHKTPCFSQHSQIPSGILILTSVSLLLWHIYISDYK